MAVSRFLALINGIMQMVVPATSSAGSSSSGQIVALNASGQVDSTMMPTGIGPTTVSVTTSAALSAGALVNLYNNSGVETARPADSTAAGSEANGFVLAATGSGATATVYTSGLITGLSGLTLGATYYLGTVGGLTTTAPSTAGNIVQFIGKAVSATSLEFVFGTPVTVA